MDITKFMEHACENGSLKSLQWIYENISEIPVINSRHIQFAAKSCDFPTM